MLAWLINSDTLRTQFTNDATSERRVMYHGGPWARLFRNLSRNEISLLSIVMSPSRFAPCSSRRNLYRSIRRSGPGLELPSSPESIPGKVRTIS